MMDLPDLAALTWLRPAWLLVLPLVVWLGWRTAPAEPWRSPWAALIDPRLRPALLTSAARDGGTARRVLRVAGLALAVVALAGPALPGGQDIAVRSTAARVLIVDLSPGTEAVAERLRLRLLELLQRMPAGHTAIVAYAEEPYLIAPPTTDAATLRLLVPELSPEIMPLPGDRPERALHMARALLARSGTRAGDVLWIAARDSAAPAVVRGLDALRADGIRVSRLRAGDPAAARETAQALRASGGLDLPLDAADGDIARLLELWHRSAASVEAIPADGSGHRELGPWLALLILPLALPLLRPGWLMLILAPTLLPAPSAHAADPSDPRWQAVAHYRAGRYAEAAARLEPLADADSLYNRGTALARLQRFDEALDALGRALALHPDDPDIRHNHALVEALMQRPPPPPSGTPSGTPPPPRDSGKAPPASDPAADAATEAQRLAEQWLRRVPDEPGGLLRQKLRLEHERRRSGGARPWE